MNVLQLNKMVFCCMAGFLLLMMTGCSATSLYSGKPDEAVPMANIPSPSSIIGYFNDIELPSGLKFDEKKSIAIQTDSFRGGVLYYSGRIEVNSLKAFVISSMLRNQWKMAGEMSYGNALLAFVKPNKTCMVNIIEGFGGSFGDTNVALYVTATVPLSAGSSF